MANPEWDNYAPKKTLSELREEINKLTEEYTIRLRQSVEIKEKSISAAAELIDLSYRGRVIDESKEPGYCGVASMETHVTQILDPKSWVHASLKRWLEKALNQKTVL